MNLLAFVLVILALGFLLYEQFRRVAHRTVFPLGVALFAAAWAVTLLWHTHHVVFVTWLHGR